MKRNNCLLLLFCILSFPAFSQRDMRPGYIVVQNDTIHGLVQYNESKNASLTCVFEKDGKRSTYSPSEITAFSFEQRLFIPATIDSTKLFAELIADGRAQLLRVCGIFHIQKGSQIVSIKPGEKSYYINGQAYIIEDRNFVGLLRVLFADCEKDEILQRKIARIHPTSDMDEQAYVDVVRTYNECLNGVTKTTSVKKAAATFGIYAGVNQTHGKVLYTTYSRVNGLFNGYEFTAQPHFSIGCFIDVANPRVSEKLHFQLEAAYSTAGFDATYKGLAKAPPSNHTTLPTYRIKYWALSIPHSIRYNLMTTSLAPYVRLGFSFSFISGQFRQRQYPNDGTTHEVDYLDVSSFAAPVFGGVGIDKNFKRCAVFVEGRYTSGPDLLDKYSDFSFLTTSFGMMAGVRF